MDSRIQEAPVEGEMTKAGNLIHPAETCMVAVGNRNPGHQGQRDLVSVSSH